MFEKYKNNVLFIKADISVEDEVKNMFEIINKTYGKLDGLVNNAAYDKINSIENLTPEEFMHFFYQDLPPIDYLIRTSGENRLSNFMLYQASYAEIYFPEVHFPDFDEKEFDFKGNINNLFLT